MALLDAQRVPARDPLYPATTQMPIAIDKTLADSIESDDENIYWPN